MCADRKTHKLSKLSNYKELMLQTDLFICLDFKSFPIPNQPLTAHPINKKTNKITSQYQTQVSSAGHWIKVTKFNKHFQKHITYISDQQQRTP